MKYPYECLACNKQFEVDLLLQEVINAAKFPAKKCPKCGGVSRRVPNKVSVHYKGKGFYSTDNKKGTE